MFYIDCLLLLLFATNTLETLSEQSWKSERNGQELLLCRKCGADVADSHYLFSMPSPGARKFNKQNIFGRQNVTIQTLVNPFGIQFNIVVAEKASCKDIGTEQGADSWFPGYTWRICTCPHCGNHLGWTFKKSLDSNISPEHKKENVQFHGLILDNVLGENFTDSLMMMPKMYRM